MADTQTINAPAVQKLGEGVHRIPSDLYHSDCCDGPSVSKTHLWVMHSQSPAHFWQGWTGNPNRKIKKASKALNVGRAAHALLLGDGTFKTEFKFNIYPREGLDKKTGEVKIISTLTNEAKDWKAEQEALGYTVISQDDMETVLAMYNALRNNKRVVSIFREGESELTYIYKDQATGIYVKSRPDLMTSRGRPIWDYKTCLSAKPGVIDKDILEYGYHLQAAIAIDALQATCNDTRTAFGLICQEKECPEAIEQVVVPSDLVNAGRAVLRKTLDQIARCIDKGVWPSYTTKAREAVVPAWQQRELDALMSEPGVQ